MSYSVKVLISAKKAWEKLGNVMGDSVTEFKTMEEFDAFYAVLIDRLHNEGPDKEST